MNVLQTDKENEKREEGKTDSIDKVSQLIERKSLKVVIPAMITVFGFIINFLSYVYEYGRISAWRLDSSILYVDVSTTVFRALINMVIGACVLLWMYLLESSWRAKSKLNVKIFDNIFLLIILAVGLFIGLNDSSLDEISFGIYVFAYVLLALVCFPFLAGLSFITMKVLRTMIAGIKEDIKSIRKMILLVVISVIVISIAVLWVGREQSKNNSSYRVTSDGYRIVYENKDNYCLVRDVEGEEGTKREYKIVDKMDVSYYYVDGK